MLGNGSTGTVKLWDVTKTVMEVQVTKNAVISFTEQLSAFRP
jgi:hypothetical protein